MNRIKAINPNQEWKVLKKEIFNNRPQETAYLAKYQFVKSLKYKNFFRELYQSTMKAYFSWEYNNVREK